MLRIFKDELLNPKNFVVTLELVPGRESKGRNTDTLKGIAREAFADGRVSAVSITDNPGGNPSLSPDVPYPLLKTRKRKSMPSTENWIKNLGRDHQKKNKKMSGFQHRTGAGPGIWGYI